MFQDPSILDVVPPKGASYPQPLDVVGEPPKAAQDVVPPKGAATLCRIDIVNKVCTRRVRQFVLLTSNKKPLLAMAKARVLIR